MDVPVAVTPGPAPDHPREQMTGSLVPDVRSTGRWSTIAIGRVLPRSLAGQFLLASLVVLVVGMLLLGAWVSRAIEHGVLNRSAALTALYVDSVLRDELQVLQSRSEFDPAQIAAFDRLLLNTPLGQRIVAFKIWSVDGRVLYSPDRRLVHQTFAIDDGLQHALLGEVTANLSDLHEEENAYERERWSRLLEVYAPVRAGDPAATVVAVVEFYQLPDELEQELGAARAQSWGVVGLVTLAIYLLLAGIVRRGSNTIIHQQEALAAQGLALQEQVVQLSRLLDQNARLHDRVRRAAEHTTALNEQALRRIGADLHDGPGQALGLALLRMHELIEAPPVDRRDETLAQVQGAVQDGLAELRAIATGLRLPALADLPLAKVVERAILAHERRCGTEVALSIGELPEQAPLSVKITLYRMLEEALSNATRHGGGVAVRAELTSHNGGVQLMVSDCGPGFDPDLIVGEGHLGLVNMRERAELLGGTTTIVSAPGRGTTVSLWLPLGSSPNLQRA
jgi:signal transduction histidine kinase